MYNLNQNRNHKKLSRNHEKAKKVSILGKKAFLQNKLVVGNHYSLLPDT